jgi:hypothetical protein
MAVLFLADTNLRAMVRRMRDIFSRRSVRAKGVWSLALGVDGFDSVGGVSFGAV